MTDTYLGAQESPNLHIELQEGGAVLLLQEAYEEGSQGFWEPVWLVELGTP